MSRFNIACYDIVFLASKVILWYYPMTVMRDTCGTEKRILKEQSPIEVLLGEIIDDRGKLEEIYRITGEMAKLDGRIDKLEKILENPKSPREIAGIGPTIAKLEAIRRRLERDLEIKQSNIRKERQATQKKLDHRVSCMISNEVDKINEQGSKYTGDTVDKIAAAGLVAYIYDAIISATLLDNQPQERNNHGS